MEYSTQGQTAGGRYAQLQSARSTFDREAKESSKLTIPSLIQKVQQVQEQRSKHLFKL